MSILQTQQVVGVPPLSMQLTLSQLLPPKP